MDDHDRIEASLKRDNIAQHLAEVSMALADRLNKLPLCDTKEEFETESSSILSILLNLQIIFVEQHSRMTQVLKAYIIDRKIPPEDALEILKGITSFTLLVARVVKQGAAGIHELREQHPDVFRIQQFRRNKEDK